MPETFPSDRNAKILRLFIEQGLSQRDIGRRLGCSGVRIGQILRKCGVDARRVVMRRRADAALIRERERISARNAHHLATIEVRYARWREMWADGMTISAIAEALGKPRPTVADRIQHYRETLGWFPRRLKRRKRRASI